MYRHQQGYCQSIWAPFKKDLHLPFTISIRGARTHSQYARDGHWNEREKLKYAVFIQHFQNLFEDEALKHAVRIYEMMADMIVTRDANQCRSHHQKMLKYRDCITNIVDSIAERYQPSLFQKIVAQYQVNIQFLIQNGHRYIRNAWYKPKPRTVQKPASTLPLPESASKKESLIKAQIADPSPAISQPLEEDAQLCKVQEEGNKCANGPTADSYESQQKEPIVEKPQQQPQPVQEMMFPFVYQLPCPLFTSLPISEDERREYRERIAQMEKKKLWHRENAELLYHQYEKENDAYKLCEVAISRWQAMLDQK